ncbi:hypothetical protein [Streptomyces termitum]|uniref:hypothetical protein n=1 Tax=Streptomyces termitum TaxID=67368 RepID=UPI0033AB8956
MALQFIGVDPESGHTGSPTVWVDTETGDVIVQSYIADEATRAECIDRNAPGHDKIIPEGETVVRLPAHMRAILKEAIDGGDAPVR